MDTKVSKLIEKLDKTISDDRDKLLLSLGLTEKEYSPNGEKSHKYNLCDYIDGKQRYYREVPMTITDEEYELILSKLKLVNEIKSKEESEQRKKQEQSSKSLSKKWTPVFSKPIEDTYEEKPAKDTGSSKLAIVMRIIAYLGGIFGIFGGLLTGDGFYIAISIISCIVCFVLFNALAEILDRFAELNAILRNGFVYKEEKSKK